jgi:hypothetical protein
MSNEAALAWVAGFVDGEGCFIISPEGAVSLTIINTSLTSLQFILQTLGVGRIYDRKQKVNKTQFMLGVYGNNCVEAIKKLLPYLIEKKPQAETLLEYREVYKPIIIPGKRGRHKNPIRDVYRQKMRDLKMESYA